MKKRCYIMFLVIISLATVFLQSEIIKISPGIVIQENYVESDEFRNMQFEAENIEVFKDMADKLNLSIGEFMAIYLCENFSGNKYGVDFFRMSQFELKKLVSNYNNQKEFGSIKLSCEALFNDLQFFPVADCQGDRKKAVYFSDSWMGERTFGGNRRHEGTDIMASVNARGIYPIVSVSDGTVEKIGWLTLGGYRIGIRSESGGYFYYAHLSSYAKNFKEGDKIKAGDVIGYMGDTGYGDEGTMGAFDVHLHFGVYIRDSEGNEISVNPFYVLKCLEKNKKSMYF